MKRISFEKYFCNNLEKGVIDFSLRAENQNGSIKFYIHPANTSGDTPDYQVEGNVLKQMNLEESDDISDDSWPSATWKQYLEEHGA